MKEGVCFDKKSLKSVTGKTADLSELAKDCVAFANAAGGVLHIGIEDGSELPPSEQIIHEDLPSRIARRINELTINVGLKQPEILSADNGGQYVRLTILRSAAAVASTTKGGYFIRDDDKSRAVMPDELIRLIADKTAYCWETKVTQQIKWNNCDRQKLSQFVLDIKDSDRATSFVKEKSEYELLSHYLMVDENGHLTNLGILWVGKQEQRARLLYSPVVQYIKYDADGNKVNKIVWDDYALNPKELIESIWAQVPDWKETYELSEGLWRKLVPAFDEKVVREVLCNAIVHRPYTTRGDIFINMYPDRMEIFNPGQFPLGVSASNILQKTVQRNEHLAKIFYDLHLMEKEGSGYDMMYATLLSTGRDIPQPFEGNDYVRVFISRRIQNKEASRLFEFVQNNYEISTKGMIALGLVLQANTITATELTNKLQLPPEERIRSYIGNLLDKEIICKRGNGKGTKYFVNPKLINNSKANIQTSLKTMESYRLKALIEEDLKYHPGSGISDILQRLPDVDFKELQRMVRIMAKDGELKHTEGRKYRKYKLP